MFSLRLGYVFSETGVCVFMRPEYDAHEAGLCVKEDWVIFLGKFFSFKLSLGFFFFRILARVPHK
jgi:hypothetical protein